MAPGGDAIKGKNNFASGSSNSMNNNNAAGREAKYFGEYGEPQGCFNNNACLCNNNAGDFQPHQLWHMPATTTTSLSQAKNELKQTEEFLESEFNKLSFQERAKALQDIHCVIAPEASDALASTQASSKLLNKSISSDHHHSPSRHPLHSTHLNLEEPLIIIPPEEQDPQSLHKLLDEFEVLIQKENNVLYNMAALQNPEYLRDPKLRLIFLRANFYKVGASVKQLLNFLKYKAEYFGKETLGREITIEDMTEEEKRMMLSGFLHIQAKRDKSGRVITIMMNQQFGKFDIATVIRASYYMWFNIVVRMPGVQTKGLTAIYYDNVPPGEEFSMPTIGFLIPLMAFSETMPHRYFSMHFCLKNTASNSGGAMRLSLNNSALSILTRGFPQYTRVRMKIHYGSDMELLYQLQAYGIDLKTFPIDVRTGKVKSDEILNKWYYDYHEKKKKKKADETSKVSNTASGSDVRRSTDDAIGHHFDDLDLDKTLDNLMNDGIINAKHVLAAGQTNEGEGDDKVLLMDDLEIDWDIDLLKDDDHPTIEGVDLNQQAVLPSALHEGHNNKGWFQTLARDAFGFGATDHAAGDHYALETTKLAVGDNGTVSSSGIATAGQTVRSTQASTAGASVPLILNSVEPTPDDILLGRGKNVQYHPGNVNFRKWLEEFRDEYERTTKKKKTRIATEMIQILSSNGIRFLKQGGQDKKSWVVADSKEAEEKIKQLFRSRRKKQRE